MACPTMKLAIGTIDGVNTLFQTPTDYKPGTVRAFTSLAQWADSITELGGKDVELCEAPCEGDLVYLYYISLL